MTYTDTTERRDYQAGSIPSDLDKLENLDDWEIADGELDPRGYDLIGADGEKIGSIDNLLASPSTQRAHFAVIDTGGWFSNKLFLIPMESITFRDGKAHCLFTKQQFRDAPEWHEGDRYYERYYGYWSGLGAVQMPSGGAAETGRATSSDEEVVIPVVEEELQVGKRQVERGIRLSSRVVERPVEETVRLRQEQVHVERRPVDRPLAEADAAAFREGTIEVDAVTEEPVVSKQARVVEEVVVGKEATERVETVRDTVRRTDVEIDEDETLEREAARR